MNVLIIKISSRLRDLAWGWLYLNSLHNRVKSLETRLDEIDEQSKGAK